MSRRLLFIAVAVGLALAFCYADVFATLWRQWSENDVFSHGFLIPLISGYLVWARRQALAAVPVRSAGVAGGLAVLVGVLVLVFGRMASIVGVQQVSLLASLAGAVLAVLGWQALRVLAFPIGYLLFMMPVWEVVTERLHWPFQIASAHLGALMLDLVGIPVLLNGNLLVLPNITLEVARVCSGVNYLIAVLAVGVPLAYLSFADWSRRIALVAFGVVMAALFNSVRVALIGFLAYYELSEIRHGPGHILQGLSVSLVGYLALFGCWALLVRLRPSRNLGLATPAASALPSPATVGAGGVLVVIALLLAGGGSRAVGRDIGAYDLNPRVPMKLGAWTAISPRASAGPPLPSAPWQDEVWREYRDQNGDLVDLYVGRYVKRRASEFVAPYWTDRLDRSSARLEVRTGAGSAKVNYVSAADTRAQDAILWYVLRGRLSTSRVLAKASGVTYGLTRQGPGPLVMLAVASPGTREPEAVLRRFAAAVIPTLVHPEAW